MAGGEGYDWYYADAAGREAQDRRPIVDGAYGEDWVFRYKDLVSWWSSPHVNRLGGVKVAGATAWQPRSKPIWFTELGCPAVNKGTNQPNVFYDPKSSESFFPYWSNGSRDDFIQYRYLQATFAHWGDPANNPDSDVYGGRMVDMARAHVWAWDARPWPDFPDRLETWVGRHELCPRPLAERAGERRGAGGGGGRDLQALRSGGGRRGTAAWRLDRVSDRGAGDRAAEPAAADAGVCLRQLRARGAVAFANRSGTVVTELSAEICVGAGREPVVSLTRSPAAETAERVTVGFVRADLDYAPGAAEALAPDAAEPRTDQMALPIVLSEGEARAIAERALSEGRVARDGLACALPPSMLAVTPGDLVSLAGGRRSFPHRPHRGSGSPGDHGGSGRAGCL